MSEAAAHIALTEGAEGFTVASIAAQARVSTRTFHNYFTFREEPLIEFLGEQVRNVTAQLSQIPTDVCVGRAIEKLLAQSLAQSESDYATSALRLFQLAGFLENSTSRVAQAALSREMAPLIDDVQSRHPGIGKFEASMVLRLLATTAIEALKEYDYDPRRSTPQQGAELLRRAFSVLELFGKPARPAATPATDPAAGAPESLADPARPTVAPRAAEATRLPANSSR